MADFCRQCSADMSGPDIKPDLANMTTARSACEPVLCEGCGIPFGFNEEYSLVFGHLGFTTFVDKDGNCVWGMCPKHGHQPVNLIQGGSVKELQQSRLMLHTPGDIN